MTFGPIVVDDTSGKFKVTSKGATPALAAQIVKDLTPVVAKPPPVSTAVIWKSAPHNDWDAASQVVVNGSRYYPESAEKPYNLQIATNATTDLTRFEVRPDELWSGALGGNDTERSELDGAGTYYPAGTDFWLAYDLLVEQGAPWINGAGGNPGGPAAWTALGQVHGHGGTAAAVPWQLSGVGEVLRVTVQTGATQQVENVLWAGPKIIRNKVYRVVSRLNISGNPAVDSACDVWIDGVQVVKFTGKIGDADPEYYFKFGCYRGWQGDKLPIMAFQYANVVQGPASLLSRVATPLPWPVLK